MDKTIHSLAETVASIRHGDTVMIGGCGGTLTGKLKKSFETIMGPMGKFAGLVEDDANGALLKMLDTLGELDKTQRTAFRKDMFGVEWSDERLRLFEARDERRRNLALANDPSNWVGSLDQSCALGLPRERWSCLT